MTVIDSNLAMLPGEVKKNWMVESTITLPLQQPLGTVKNDWQEVFRSGRVLPSAT